MNVFLTISYFKKKISFTFLLVYTDKKLKQAAHARK